MLCLQHYAPSAVRQFRVKSLRCTLSHAWAGLRRRNQHKDGWHFKHFLNSPDQALLITALFSDVLPGAGGTFIAADSPAHVARWFAEHPEGQGGDNPPPDQEGLPTAGECVHTTCSILRLIPIEFAKRLLHDAWICRSYPDVNVAS